MEWNELKYVTHAIAIQYYRICGMACIHGHLSSGKNVVAHIVLIALNGTLRYLFESLL